MRKLKRTELIGELKRARERFELWRSRRKHRREPIPEKLWRRAVKLAEGHGVHRTAQALGLHYDRLKERVRGQTDISGGKFVEVLPGMAPFVGGSVIKIEKPDGSKLHIELTGGEAQQVGELTRYFLEKV